MQKILFYFFYAEDFKTWMKKLKDEEVLDILW